VGSQRPLKNGDSFTHSWQNQLTNEKFAYPHAQVFGGKVELGF